MDFKAGFVNIVGNPNVGKSTLMNSLVGEKLSIITSKAQTTRHRIMGIVNGKDFQIVYSDTPGIIVPHYKMQSSMMKFVSEALTDADVILYVTDIYETPDKNQAYIDKLSKTKKTLLLLINKIDQDKNNQVEELTQHWSEALPKAKIIPISALQGTNVAGLFDLILAGLPAHPAFYPEDALTDKTERFFVSEIIREKILTNYHKEIPYSVEIEVEEFKEDVSIIHIRAVIHVMRRTQKGIIIGHKGEKLKKVGTEARIDMETFFGKKVFLELFVKITEDWRDKDYHLRQFGYK